MQHDVLQFFQCRLGLQRFGQHFDRPLPDFYVGVFLGDIGHEVPRFRHSHFTERLQGLALHLFVLILPGNLAEDLDRFGTLVHLGQRLNRLRPDLRSRVPLRKFAKQRNCPGGLNFPQRLHCFASDVFLKM